MRRLYISLDTPVLIEDDEDEQELINTIYFILEDAGFEFEEEDE